MIRKVRDSNLPENLKNAMLAKLEKEKFGLWNDFATELSDNSFAVFSLVVTAIIVAGVATPYGLAAALTIGGLFLELGFLCIN